MAEEQLHSLIEGIRTRFREELEGQLGTVAETHTRMLEQARQSAAAEAEQRWSAQLDASRAEWSAQLDAAVAKIRSEADAANASELARVRAESEHAATAAATSAREAAQQTAATERQRLEALLEAERRRASELELDQQRATTDLNAQRQRVSQLEGERERTAAELEAQRARIVQLEGSRQPESELQAQRDLIASLQEEVDRGSAELTALRNRVTQFDAERRRADTEAQSVRAAAAAELEAARQNAAREPVTLSSSKLLATMRAVEEAPSLTQMLAAAVRGAASEASRATVFVVNGAELQEWPGTGVPTLGAGPLRAGGPESGILADALRRHEAVATNDTDGGAAPFFAALPPDGVALTVPVILGGTPVAILYAEHHAAGTKVSPEWTQRVQIVARHAAACAGSLTAARTAEAMRFLSGESHDGAAAGSALPQDDVHAARRYARLLVSEIKLYNEPAVRLGREHRDLLARLEPEIDRARRLYDARVPASVPARAAVFEQELALTLADGDAALLGFPGHAQQSWQ